MATLWEGLERAYGKNSEKIGVPFSKMQPSLKGMGGG